MVRLIATVLGGAFLGNAALADEVGLRVGEHPGFGRIVLEWSEPSAVAASFQEDELSLTFDRSLGELDLTPAIERLPDHLVGFAPGERLEEMVLQIADGVRPNVWTSGRLTIVDLYRPILDPPLVPVRISADHHKARLVFDWPQPVSFGVREEDGRVRISFGAAGRIDPLAIAAGLGDLVHDARADSGKDWSQVELALARPVAAEAREIEQGRIQIDLAVR